MKEKRVERNVIYFPYIRVPQNQWFKRVLLYWDKIGSIVPMEYVDNPARLGKYMQGLVREGLVTQILPMEYSYKIPNFIEAFLAYVDGPNYPVRKGVLEKKKLPTFRVHMEKLGPIGDGLSRRGLARITDEWAWYDIECYTAIQFMAYLATALGKLPEIKSEPITDKAKRLSVFAPEPNRAEMSQQEIDEMRTLVLKDIMPAPSSRVDPYEIAKFKDDHKRELKRFRNKVEAFLINVAGIESQAIRSQMIDEFIRGIRDEVDALAELMKERGWKNISLGRFLAYSTAGIGLTAAIGGGGLLGGSSSSFWGRFCNLYYN